MSSVDHINVLSLHLMEDEATPVATVIHSSFTTFGPSSNGLIEVSNSKAKIEYSATTETVLTTTSIIIYNPEDIVSDIINTIPN
uniref:Uncharacterized protein n=1 Tax=Strongyloides stercoralis TaxID=6248 RepID=A0A0K0EKY9_STRER